MVLCKVLIEVDESLECLGVKCIKNGMSYGKQSYRKIKS